MPDGDASYYVNVRMRPPDRYEDYLVQDLISDVEAKFPVNSGRSHRAIIGISMGGFGAVNLSLKHPGLFIFAAANEFSNRCPDASVFFQADGTIS